MKFTTCTLLIFVSLVALILLPGIGVSIFLLVIGPGEEVQREDERLLAADPVWGEDMPHFVVVSRVILLHSLFIFPAPAF